MLVYFQFQYPKLLMINLNVEVNLNARKLFAILVCRLSIPSDVALLIIRRTCKMRKISH